MYDSSPKKVSYIIIVYATWNSDKRDDAKLYATDQSNFYRFNNDGIRLCAKTQISKSLFVTPATASIRPDFDNPPPTTKTLTLQK